MLETYNRVMDPQRCSRCGRPFTVGEVTGLGILRSRLESRGGPLMEFTCPGCGWRMTLVPHGSGRYAFPGNPPPPAVPEAERVPPWVHGPRRTAPPPPPAPVEEPAEEDLGEEPPVVIDPPPPPEEDEPLTLAQALEILGIGPEADRAEVERAFRERSRTCHPDKVAHLDPDFQVLAERKFKRLKNAYDLLTS